ncbi:hypothetical protein NESM_000407500 [Novymonas esmeraldas]|uniref:Uncharacterized protein n=1 Tax=Novymonas esmeraldas TaxID=1808958 RepID=A0AAW0EL53_9TRYP
MSTYYTIPRTLFHFLGGLCITQWALPTLRDSITGSSAASPHTKTAAPPAVSSSGSLSGLWGSVRWSVETSTTPPLLSSSLADDMEEVLRTHCWLAAMLLALAVASGGTPAVLGSGLSVCAGGGAEGRARYCGVKQRVHELWRKANTA